jgi:RNA polymerase sigma factor (sigma-70 family)
MVWGVCRRVLRRHHDAEDAFQATFLVLVRKAASIASRELLANWLYGVAHRTALKAGAAIGKRHRRERQVTPMPEPEAVGQDSGDDLLPLLDQELSRLPDRYRVPVILCDLEGKTRKEAARQLGVPEGTVAGRLARARALLAKRLARPGRALSGAGVSAVLVRSASASVPAAVASSTVKAAGLLAAGQAAAVGAISARVVVLTEGVLKAMLLTKLKAATGMCLAVGMLIVLGAVLTYRAPAADKTTTAPSDDKLRDTLLVLDKQWYEAASKYDVDTLSKILADDWVGFVPHSGPHWNKAKALARYRQSRFTQVQFTTKKRMVRIDECTAILSYEIDWRGEEKDGSARTGWRGRMIRCWVQRDGGWFVKYDEYVPYPAEATTVDPTKVEPTKIDPLKELIPSCNDLVPFTG